SMVEGTPGCRRGAGTMPAVMAGYGLRDADLDKLCDGRDPPSLKRTTFAGRRLGRAVLGLARLQKRGVARACTGTRSRRPSGHAESDGPSGSRRVRRDGNLVVCGHK